MNDFKTLPDTPVIRLDNLTLPACIVGASGDLVRG